MGEELKGNGVKVTGVKGELAQVSCSCLGL